MEEEPEIELRTEDVNEILTSPPQTLHRWGITIIFSMIVLCFVLSYFIRYPETLLARATITTLNPPINIISKTNGKLTHLFVQNNQEVKTNQLLAVIENPADYHDLFLLDSNLTLLKNNIKINEHFLSVFDSLSFSSSLSSSLINTTSISLGDLTTSYLLFLKSYKDFKLFTDINPQQQEIALLNKELLNYTSLLNGMEKQVLIYNEEYSLTEKDYNRDHSLYEQKMISTREYEAKKKEFLSYKQGLENQKNSVTNTKIAINAIEKNKLQLQIQYIEQHNKLKNDLEQNIKNLQAQIVIWKQTYLFFSPIEGKISFFNYWAVNQNIKQGDNLFNLVPLVKQELIAKLILPTINTGKLKPEQDVNIKLDNYPYTEFGMLKGKVKNISLVPTNNAYAIDVVLTNGLITTYHKNLSYKEEMTGTAEIITENLSLLERILMNFKKLIDR